MNRLVWVVALLALFTVGFAPVTVRAFDIPGSGDGDSSKKKKKKKATDDSKSDSSDSSAAPAAKDDSSKTDNSNAASKDSGTGGGGGKTNADSGANPPPAPAVQTIESKTAKSLWDVPFMKEVKVGDFLEYEMPAAPNMRTHMEIAEMGDHTMTLLSRTLMSGKAVAESKCKMIYTEADPDPKQVEEAKKKYTTKTFDDKIKIGDKGEFAATRTETYENDKLVSKMWTCKDVPYGGLVRSEGPDGKAYQVLVNFGRGK